MTGAAADDFDTGICPNGAAGFDEPAHILGLNEGRTMKSPGFD